MKIKYEIIEYMDKKELEKLKKNFPKIPGILGRERYYNSAVLIPLVLKENQYYLLLEKRALYIKQGGDICFPGGGFEEKNDKTFLDTALRETYEELGIKSDDVKVIGQFDTMVTSIGAIIEIYVGIIEEEVLTRDLKLSKEVEKMLLISLKKLKASNVEEYTLKQSVEPSYINTKGNKKVTFPAKQLGLPSRYQKPWGNKNYQVLLYRVEGEIIWGVTAQIIHDLLKKY